MPDTVGDAYAPAGERSRTQQHRGLLGDSQCCERWQVDNPDDQVTGEDLISEMDLTHLQGGTNGTRVESERHRVVIVQHHLDEEMATVSCGER